MKSHKERVPGGAEGVGSMPPPAGRVGRRSVFDYMVFWATDKGVHLVRDDGDYALCGRPRHEGAVAVEGPRARALCCSDCAENYTRMGQGYETLP